MAILISEHGKIFDPTRIQDSVPSEADLQRPPNWVGRNLQTENSLCSPVGSLLLLRCSAAKPHRQDCSQKGNQPASSLKPRKQGSSPGKGSEVGPFYHPPPRSSILGSCCFSFHENWLVGGRLAVQGHLGGQGKDSDSCQRPSTYDNVPVLALSEDARSNASPSGSISSSGLSLAVDSVTPWATCKARACLALNPLPKGHPPGRPLPQGEVSLESSGGEPEAGCGRSRDEPNLSITSGDAGLCSEALQALITELKVELRKQKSQSETAFKRMEQASTGLRKLVTRLGEELIQEKQQQAMLEIKLRNSERARKDAEERNHFLQEEALGSITAGESVGQSLKETPPFHDNGRKAAEARKKYFHRNAQTKDTASLMLGSQSNSFLENIKI